ncbi:xanthine phosphoribosyltransferase [Thalassotalea sp. PS06]|uniref:xanthine phosphoribosyltransferase n=1 Tax=Thalassotalea sp. PS06 TaxID=2594005 RepID=UPI001161F7EA|nr:xanthine phosphoribosyltransferase [Thalassotalea sp. PS06]QDP01674.1 xanthine phosphoribosyltransferase [Thalassotalea sp. PS06]
MKIFQERILKDGIVVNNSAIDVSSFITRQIDSNLMAKCAQKIAKYYSDKHIDRIVTIESGGIAISMLVSVILHVPLVVMKKQRSILDPDDMLISKVYSFTKAAEYELSCFASHIHPDEKVLFVDDVLAFGNAVNGVIDILKQANARLAGCAFLLEKSFQPGRKILDDADIDVLSLARLASLKNGIEFVSEASLRS